MGPRPEGGPEASLGTSSEPALACPQAWKNATLAEQAKLPATEKPVLLSKDIEAKMMALDREVQYLLNKAKFSKPRPRPKDKNGTRAEPPVNATASEEAEKVIRPPGEGRAWLQVLLAGSRPPSPAKLHCCPGFPAGHTEGAEPVSEPETATASEPETETATGELGTLGAAIAQPRALEDWQAPPVSEQPVAARDLDVFRRLLKGTRPEAEGDPHMLTC